ncbi:NAD-binding protein [Pseudonocardia sp. H11422]|uniref:NAD-binding protein n=1 Tax=Pseudonocardia sp. H11422 TaxID=2835866 RepID=UPI001BDC2E75
MVGVEVDEQARGVSPAGRVGIPVVIGDASREETLQAAHVGTCRALLTVTNNDVTNLGAALNGRANVRGPTRRAAVVRSRPRRTPAQLRDHDLPERVLPGRARLRRRHAAPAGARNHPGRPQGAADRRGAGAGRCRARRRRRRQRP